MVSNVQVQPRRLKPLRALGRMAASIGLALVLATSAAETSLAQDAVGFDEPNPALFVARDDDTTIYLFGTIHALPCMTDIEPPVCASGLNPAIRAAIAEADEVWLEIADPLSAGNDPNLLLQAGMFRDGSRLSDFIPQQDIAEIARAIQADMVRLTRMDLTVELVISVLDTLMPWVVSTMLSTSVLEGETWDFGVDIEVARLAGELGVPVLGFETVEEQLGFAASEPFEHQIAFLRYLAAMLRHGIDMSAVYQWLYMEVWELWRDGRLDGVDLLTYGDVDLISETYNNEIAAHLGITEAEYAAAETEAEAVFPPADQAEQRTAQIAILLEGRNLDWMADIDQMLARPGTFFIAVGAAHLVGAFGLPALLEQAGVTVERVQ